MSALKKDVSWEISDVTYDSGYGDRDASVDVEAVVEIEDGKALCATITTYYIWVYDQDGGSHDVGCEADCLSDEETKELEEEAMRIANEELSNV